jgi:hypothetical protein
MTRSTAPDRTPGTFLLKVARVVFDESVRADVIEPTIADLREEVAAAYAPKDRLVARLRGYAAFWRLVAVAPVAFIGWRPSRAAAYTSPAIGIAAGILLVLAFTPPSLRPWMLVTIAGGTIVAVITHAWYARHPTSEVVPEGTPYRRPEINLSSIPVRANIGGLIFMVGSVFIVIAGLPKWHWFFVVAAAGGVFTGALIFRWHAKHPTRGLPDTYVISR